MDSPDIRPQGSDVSVINSDNVTEKTFILNQLHTMTYETKKAAVDRTKVRKGITHTLLRPIAVFNSNKDEYFNLAESEAMDSLKNYIVLR